MKREMILSPKICKGFSMPNFLGEVREMLINKAMNIAGGNYSEAARLLGISTPAVFKACKKLKK